MEYKTPLFGKKFALFLLLLMICLGAGFAVRDSDAVDEQFRPTTTPGKVYVADFDLAPDLVQTDDGPLEKLRKNSPLPHLLPLRRGGLLPHRQTPEELAQQITQTFSATLMQELAKASVPVERSLPGAPLPRDGWIIRGQFSKVDEGNAVESAVVGFGMGGPHIEAAGDVADLSTDPPAAFLTFGGTNKTRKLPGGIITRNPYVIAAKFVLAKGATEREVRELATQMASEIVAYMKEHQLLPAAC
jgi:hypothetical protein